MTAGRLPRRLALALVVAALTLFALEGGLRLLTRHPTGQFRVFLAGGGLLFEPDQRLTFDYGLFPFVIATNSLGLRGPEVDIRKAAGVQRIVALGDSVTLGFFVENDDTWPHQLELRLRAEGRRAEVLNAARSGGSIDMERAILDERVLPLAPDLVLLTFVTNDIGELRGKTRQDLTAAGLDPPRLVGLTAWLATRTALGEWTLDRALGWRSRYYRHNQRAGTPVEGAARYQIPGGDDFAANVATFRQRYADSDGLVLGGTWDAATERAVVHWAEVLGAMATSCRQAGVRLAVQYYPSYDQVYDPTTSMAMRDRVQAECDRLGLPLLDLTAGLREAGHGRVLHLAPRDFHLNPEGNRALAEASHRALARAGLLDPLP